MLRQDPVTAGRTQSKDYRSHSVSAAFSTPLMLSNVAKALLINKMGPSFVRKIHLCISFDAEKGKDLNLKDI